MAIKTSTQRFSDKVDHYIKYRPHYPAEIIPFLCRMLGLCKEWAIADIGSGTGISCELFLQHGNVVYAVEPNREMREAAERIFSGNPLFRSLPGTAEATGIEDGAVDMIVSGQAFHWFDVEKSKKEFARILKPGGLVLLMWNDRRTDTTAFLKAYEKLLLDHGTDYREVNHKNFDDKVMDLFFGMGNWKQKSFPNYQYFDLEGLTGRLLSSSYIPDKDQPGYQPMLDELKAIFEKYHVAGKVAVEYDTRLYYGVIS
ncbi:MAG: class I SAM-dependent methyltransferase [Bacteroidota bacterium]